ncbi:hypothetical protein SBRCBS47491_004118 [Sporothrix bragantina]|uniref:Reticulon-like protein n=1 Tax=Sporothrix bragantina TaxID=671064 RepID=A0ABP0BL44_9PEZI
MADTAGFPTTNGGLKNGSTKVTDASSFPSASTQQPLTHYHSLFSDLLSWNNPRNTGIAYGAIVALIVAFRFLDVLRWGLRLTWIVLGVTVAAEIAGKLVLNKGFASQLRPRKYYTLSRESLDNVLGDVHELLNFFVIEAQRILYAENVYVSAAACVTAFLSYYLVKVVPYWGLALLSTTILFFAPLIYKTNKELIDDQLKQASDLVNAQTSQLRDVASKHTSHATEVTKQYMGDYTAKAQELLGGRSAPVQVPKPATTSTTTSTTAKTTSSVPSVVASAPAAPKTEPVTTYEATDFPAAPKEDLKPEVPVVLETTVPAKTEEEPLVSL